MGRRKNLRDNTPAIQRVLDKWVTLRTVRALSERDGLVQVLLDDSLHRQGAGAHQHTGPPLCLSHPGELER
jgi:hypothetical protein